MVIKKVLYGKVEDVTVINLGEGDVMIGTLQNPTEKYTGVYFKNDTEKKDIGTTTEIGNGMSTDEFQPEVVIAVDRPESFDVLIEKLQQARKLLINKQFDPRK